MTDIPHFIPDPESPLNCGILRVAPSRPAGMCPSPTPCQSIYVGDPSVMAALITDPDWVALEVAAATYVDGSRGLSYGSYYLYVTSRALRGK
jgi:hypothetical protein